MAERNWVNLASLTNYQVAPDGSSVLLNARDADGNEVSVILPMDPLRQLAFTAPKMVVQSLAAAGVDRDAARLVHPVGSWKLESSEEPGRTILTLESPDRFEVSFAVEDGTLQQIAEVLAEIREDALPAASHLH